MTAGAEIGVESILTIAESVAEQAGAGEQVEAYVARSRSCEARARDGEIESLEQAGAAGIGVRIVVGGRQGFAYAGSLDDDAVAEALAEARDNVAVGSPDDANGLAVPDDVIPPELDLHRDDLVETSTERKVDLALELERAVRGFDPRISGVYSAGYADGIGESAIATSTGIRAHTRATRCHVWASALASDGDETHTGYGWSVGRRVDDLDVEAAAGDAASRAVALLGAAKPASQRLTVVLEPRVAATFLNVLGGTLSGEAVLKGRSPFGERQGEPVAAGILTVVDDPTDPRSLGASPHDGEGLASRRNALVDDGVLGRFLHNTWSARRAGTASTASAVRGYASPPGVGARALALRPGSIDRAALLAEVGDGFLVESVSGVHSGVNPVSGDVSVGATGHMVRGGEVAEAVREVTIGSTLQRMLLDVVAVGSDLEWLPGGTGAATLAIADVSLSGT